MMRFHPESPDVDGAALSRLRFVAEFKKTLHQVSGGNAAAYKAHVAGQSLPDDLAERRLALRDRMEQQPFFQGWSSMMRSSQDLMWRYTGQAVQGSAERLATRFKSMSNQAKGSVTLNADLAAPGYLTDSDVHRMPGGYAADDDTDDLFAGALYDLGGAVYQLGRANAAGGLLNDTRGHTLLAHLATRFPDFAPTRILDLGCNVGHNTVPLAAAFPDAETVGVDVGAALLRYAHLRAEGLGVAVQFVQADAEHTGFADASFDLVVSQIILHETTPEATDAIIRESRRLLRPGGIAVHLEIPFRASEGNDFEQFMWLWEQNYNAEPNIAGVLDGDLVGMARAAGLSEVEMGYQDIPSPSGESAFHAGRRGGHGLTQWLVVSGRAA
jgi:SAM-dependent methyltransferase